MVGIPITRFLFPPGTFSFSLLFLLTDLLVRSLFSFNVMLKSILESLKRIESIKVKPPSTLFDVEPNWEKLQEGRCPICATKLSIPRKNPFIVICRGKRHGDKKPFLIKRKKYEELSRKKLSPVIPK